MKNDSFSEIRYAFNLGSLRINLFKPFSNDLKDTIVCAIGTPMFRRTVPFCSKISRKTSPLEGYAKREVALSTTNFSFLNHGLKGISQIPQILNIGNVGVADQVTIRDTGIILNNN